MAPRRWQALVALALTLASCSTSAPTRPEADSLSRFIEEFFFAWVQRDPEWFSSLRPFGDDVDPYGDQLSDVSLAAQQDRLRFARSALARLSRYDLSKAEPGLRVCAEALAWYLDDQLRGAAFQLSDYPLNHYDGDPLRLIRFMTDLHVIRSLDPNRPALQKDARLIRVTPAGTRESHVHDVAITKEAPNYRSE